MKKILFAAALAAMTLTACCDGGKTAVVMGDSSEFDSLSYALGANIATGMSYQLSEVPFDYKAIDREFQKAALNKTSVSHDDARKVLQDYFSYQKFAQRKQEIARKRAEADSIRQANGEEPEKVYAADPDMFESEEEREEVSSAFGTDLGYNVRESGLPLQVVWMLEGMQNVRDKNAKMSEDEIGRYLQHYFMVTRPAENAEASKAWLEKIEKKSGVKKTESGLLYKVIKAGDKNLMPSDPRDVVKVHYTGRLRTGKVFDTSLFKNRPKEQQEMMKLQLPDSYDKDEPVEFPLNRVIKGWTEGMQLVGKGGKIKLWIPSELAYGSSDNGRIGPNEALEFEVELIDVTPYEAPAPVEAEPEAQGENAWAPAE
ncbi:MAG: FKBP-type peptidyl-prolyl cis-trans isomerase [Alistipes sp.]|nr:FKBP-type peptidyl-prolyl cis-trans isomerase [Alistipes sp.]